MKNRWKLIEEQHSLMFDDQTWFELLLRLKEGEQPQTPLAPPALGLVIQNDSESAARLV